MGPFGPPSLRTWQQTAERTGWQVAAAPPHWLTTEKTHARPGHAPPVDWSAAGRVRSRRGRDRRSRAARRRVVGGC
jgi:hypothetical protein